MSLPLGARLLVRERTSMTSGLKPVKNPWLILFLISCPYMLSTFLRASPSVMAVELAEEFQVSLSQLAPVSGLYVLAYGVMQIPSGVLADVIGARRTMGILLFCLAVGNFGFSLSDTVGQATMARCLAGCGASLIVPSLVVLSDVFSGRLYAKASAALLFLGNTGVALAAAPFVFLVSLVGWRALMTDVACLCIFFALLLVLFLPRQVARQEARELSILGRIRTVCRAKGFWPLAFIYTCITGMFFSFSSFWWGPTLIQGGGFSQQTAGTVMFFGSLALLAGIPSMVAAADFFSSHRRVLQIILFMACMANVLQGLFLGRMPSGAMMFLGGMFVFCSGTGAVVFSATRSLVPASVIGTAMGCMNALPCLVTGVFQWLFGAMLEMGQARGMSVSASYGLGLFANAVILGLALMCACFLLKETYPQKTRD